MKIGFIDLNADKYNGRKQMEMRQCNTFLGDRHVLQAPLRNSGKIKDSES